MADRRAARDWGLNKRRQIDGFEEAVHGGHAAAVF